MTAAPSSPSLPDAQQVLGLCTLAQHLSIVPDYETCTLNAASVLTTLNSNSQPLSTVPLILYHKLPVSSAHSSSGQALAFSQRVVPMADDRATRGLRRSQPGPAAAGGSDHFPYR